MSDTEKTGDLLLSSIKFFIEFNHSFIFYLLLEVNWDSGVNWDRSLVNRHLCDCSLRDTGVSLDRNLAHRDHCESQFTSAVPIHPILPYISGQVFHLVLLDYKGIIALLLGIVVLTQNFFLIEQSFHEHYAHSHCLHI